MVKYLIRTLADGHVYFTLEYNGFVMLACEPQPTMAACLAYLNKARLLSKDYGAYRRSTSSDSQFFFTLQRLRNDKVAQSGFFESKVAMEVGVELVREFGYSALVEEGVTPV